MPESKALKDTGKNDKAAMMVDLHNKHKATKPKELTGSARKSFCQKIRPVALCTHTCFSDSVEDFCLSIDKLNNGDKFKCPKNSAGKSQFSRHRAGGNFVMSATGSIASWQKRLCSSC